MPFVGEAINEGVKGTLWCDVRVYLWARIIADTRRVGYHFCDLRAGNIIERAEIAVIIGIAWLAWPPACIPAHHPMASETLDEGEEFVAL